MGGNSSRAFKAEADVAHDSTLSVHHLHCNFSVRKEAPHDLHRPMTSPVNRLAPDRLVDLASGEENHKIAQKKKK